MNFKKLSVTVAIIGLLGTPSFMSYAITYVPDSYSSETDPYYNAGKITGGILGNLIRRNRTPHINVHKQYIYVGTDGSSAFYIDLGSAKSIKNTADFKLAKADFIYVEYNSEKIIKDTIHISYDLKTEIANFSVASVTAFDYKGKLVGGPVEGDNPELQPIAYQSPTSAAVNTIYNKLYGTSFYNDSSIPILTETQSLVD